MKRDRLLNPGILEAVATTGHTEYLVIADCGLPVPAGVKVVDVSVSAGIPKFLDVLKAVDAEMVVESIVVASEIEERNPAIWQAISQRLGDLPVDKVPHTQFKKLTEKAKYIVRTGETSPYANVILVGGVNF